VAAALAAAAVAVVGVLIAQGVAGAHDHRVPRTALIEGDQSLQTGRKVWEYMWVTTARDDTCVLQQAILDFGFPRSTPTVEPGSKLALRINKSQRPRSLKVDEVDENGEPGGTVDVRLRPVTVAGETVAWDAIFRARRPDADYRLAVEGHWPDREDCGPADQFAYWTFHFRTNGTP
jgi:hypothetical protein